jgi:LuxR family maltose regulon positive regulatory protein
MLREICPFSLLDGWLDIVEARLTASLTTQEHEESSCSISDPKIQQELKAQLGQVFIQRASLRALSANGQAALALCQQALPLLPADNLAARAMMAWCQVWAFYYSVNDAVAAIESGLQAISLAHKAKQPNLAASCSFSVALYMIAAGRLHATYELLQQEMHLIAQPGRLVSLSEGKVINMQAEVMREWNQLDAALSTAEEAVMQHKQTDLRGALTLLTCGYAILLRVYLSRGDLDAACVVLQELETISTRMNEPVYVYHYSLFTIVDQVRLWLACGKLDQATHWMEQLKLRKWHSSPFAQEREDVACIRILLAKNSPDLALQRLDAVLQRTIAGQRWAHVIEARLLQAMAHQMCQQQTEALNALSEAVRLGEPEGYIRSFLEEGTLVETLLHRLCKRERRNGPTPYLDTLLTAFQQDRIARSQMRASTKKLSLLEPLSKRELLVLDWIARGASNSEIAQELEITVDTVKHHVSHIFSKLGVLNRVQVVRQARELGLLAEEC